MLIVAATNAKITVDIFSDPFTHLRTSSAAFAQNPHTSLRIILLVRICRGYAVVTCEMKH